MIGTLISGKYRVVRKLGQGGMGTVYQVRHVGLDTTLALKLLPNHLADNPDLVARFQREARVMARLRHDHIVKVFDFTRDDNLYYLLEEFIDGQHLGEYIKGRGSLPVIDALEIARQLADALGYAHERGVIHRDIKPSNVLIDRAPPIRALLTDFGIAKVDDDSERTRTGLLLGTVRYAAPEQAGLRGPNGRLPVDGRADVFALGLVLFEMCEGRQFFAGLDETEIIGRLVYERDPLVPQFFCQVPHGVTSLIARAIARDPSERHQSMAELLRDIGAALEEATVDGDRTVVGATVTKTRVTDAELEERIRSLQAERERRLALAAQAQVQAARAEAAAAEAPELAPTLFDQGLADEHRADAGLAESRFLEARELFERAEQSFARAGAEAGTARRARDAARARATMLEAKRAADRERAADLAATAYARARLLENKGDQQTARQEHEGARDSFVAASDAYGIAATGARAATERVGAESARSEMQRHRAAALEIDASALAPEAYQRAHEAEALADAALANGSFVTARDGFVGAASDYERAVHDAEAEREMRQRIAEVARQEAAAVALEAARRVAEETAAMTVVEHPVVDVSIVPATEDEDAPADAAGGGEPALESDDVTHVGMPTIVVPPTMVRPPSPVEGLESRPAAVRVAAPAVQPERITAEAGRGRWSRRLIAGSGVVAVLMVGVVAWNVVAPKREVFPRAPTPVLPEKPPAPPPLAPLAWKQVSPADAAVEVKEGERLDFTAVVANGDNRLEYTWFLDKEPRSTGGTWTYEPSFDVGGSTKEVRVVAVDQDRRLERAWQVKVANINRPPTIESSAPDGEVVQWSPGHPQEFAVVASDPDAGDGRRLKYTWEIDGRTVASGGDASWVLKDLSTDGAEVGVRVADESGAESSLRSWKIARLPPPPAPKPPPRILSQKPAPGKVSVEEGASVDFSARAEGDSPTYTWRFDGTESGRGPSWKLKAPTGIPRAETHTVQLEVADANGQAAPRTTWTVEVVPTLPKIVDYQPRAARLAGQPGETKEFSVKVRSPADGSVRHEWTLDGKRLSAEQGERLRLSGDLEAGQHTVEVVALDARGGRSTTQRWTLEVKPSRPTPAEAASVMTPISPEPPATAISEADVRDWLVRYRNAWERKDADALASIGAITRDAKPRVEAAVRAYGQLRVSTSNESIRIEGNTATVSFDRTDQDETGKKLPHERQTYRLEKGASGVSAVK